MFQVASRPTHHHGAVPEPLNLAMSHYQTTPVAQKLNIPRRLARPSFAEPSRDAITRIDPGLAGVPLEYIRRSLAGNANQRVPRSCSQDAHCSVPFDDPELASVRAPSTYDRRARPAELPDTRLVSIPDARPRHPLFTVLINHPDHCVLRRQSLHARVDNRPTLPRLCTRARLALRTPPCPAPTTFPLLHAYLHTMRPDTLLASLLPALASALPQLSGANTSAGSNKLVYVAQFSSDRLLRLAHALAGAALQRGGSQGGAMSTLMSHIKVVNGLWQNVCALGVFDAELWGVMDLAWEVILAAMTKVSEGR
ncbi:hypothetical protein ONZ51_g3937 [Trametes cubensis]|uniref:Clampless protein 1 n=1 Tax=Trametes cubensis TaxID=1111947 RepID=A0AAD7TZ83_9APHY|nr:hypothetical protein ONZ51_g3937 [Trametes cubensis]